jgi:type II secretory pathway pseudopilin PulG
VFAKLKRVLSHFKDERGIGLVESLVAIAILGVSVTALITDLSAGSIAVNVQSDAVLAQSLAQSQLETIKGATYDTAGTSYTVISAPSGYAVSVNTNSSIYSNNNIQKITVTVTHSGNPILVVEDYKVNR